jgi:hypothetical protein
MSNNTTNKNNNHIKIYNGGTFNQFQAKWPLDALTIEKSTFKNIPKLNQNNR